MSKIAELWGKRRVRLATGLIVGLAAIAAVVPFALKTYHKVEAKTAPHAGRDAEAADRRPERQAVAEASPGQIRLTAAQQGAIGLKVAKAEPSPATESIDAPGRITPDEGRYAYITPRAAGVVRNVAAQIGQDVVEGELLATIDSPEVGQARLDLLSKGQLLEVARTKAEWQEGITSATLELIDRLRSDDSPEEIRRRFEGRAIGADRERLMTADAQRRVTWTALQRNKELLATDAVPLSRYQMVMAEYEAALATYQGLMDRVGVETRLANTLAQQQLREAQTADRVARERLRVLGVSVEPDKPEAGPRSSPGEGEPTPAPPKPATPSGEPEPLSTYTIRAPFDGTILDREMIVPGVALGTTQRIFTIADLRTVWVEASVHESHFGLLAGSQGAEIELQSPAYPGKTFAGTVLYTGDIVDEKSRMVKLLARAENPDRALKPGMYVDVTIRSRSGRNALLVPDTAILTEANRTFVFVRTEADQFARHDVLVGEREKGRVSILQGLEPGDEVVTQGAFKLKAEAIRMSGG